MPIHKNQLAAEVSVVQGREKQEVRMSTQEGKVLGHIELQREHSPLPLKPRVRRDASTTTTFVQRLWSVPRCLERFVIVGGSHISCFVTVHRSTVRSLHVKTTIFAESFECVA
jgi:hypothetical protein